MKRCVMCADDGLAREFIKQTASRAGKRIRSKVLMTWTIVTGKATTMVFSAQQADVALRLQGLEFNDALFIGDVPNQLKVAVLTRVRAP